MDCKQSVRVVVAVVVGVGAICSGASGAIIDFNDVAHGEIVSDQYAASDGVIIRVHNAGGGPHLALGFDGTTPSRRDPDLVGPWRGGNLPSDTDLGHLLIIAENAGDLNGDGLIDVPDDEGSRPAGTVFFDFARPIVSFGFDLIDIEGPSEYGDDSGYFATLFSGDTELSRLGFGELIHRDGALFGNNTLNRIAPISATDFSLPSGIRFDSVQIQFGGSGAIDNIQYMPAPIPAAWVLLGTGLIGFAGARRVLVCCPGDITPPKA